MIIIVRNREAGELDSVCDPLLVDGGHGCKTLSNHDFSPLYVIGHQEGIGRPAWRGYRIAGGIDYEMLGGITSADPSHIADVVGQRGENGMSPIAGSDDPLKTTSAKYVLNTKGNQRSVLAIVIERVAVGDAFHDEAGGFVESGGHFWVLIAIDFPGGLGGGVPSTVGYKGRPGQDQRLPFFARSRVGP